MQRAIEVDNLRFEFSDAWEFVKLDDHEFFREHLQKLQSTKAVDFAALHLQRDLYLVEVSDYRGNRIELKNADQGQSGMPLHIELARKVKDSVACIVGAARTRPEPLWRAFADRLRDRASLRVLFWLECDAVSPPRHSRRKSQAIRRFEQQLDMRKKRCKQSLAWLTNQVDIANSAVNPKLLPGVTITSIGRAGSR